MNQGTDEKQGKHGRYGSQLKNSWYGRQKESGKNMDDVEKKREQRGRGGNFEHTELGMCRGRGGY